MPFCMCLPTCRMPEFNFVTSSTRFKCKRCAKCCSLDVLLSRNELEQLGENADLKWRTTRKVMGKSDPICCLLNSKTCTIYSSRPKLCRLYPFFAISVAELELFKVGIPEEAIKVKGKNDELYVVIYDDRCPGTDWRKRSGDTNPSKNRDNNMDACNCQDVVSLTLEHLEDFR